MRSQIEPGPSAIARPVGAGSVLVERPPEGLARGKVAASVWTIAAIGAAAFLLTATYFWRRLTRRRSS